MILFIFSRLQYETNLHENKTHPFHTYFQNTGSAHDVTCFLPNILDKFKPVFRPPKAPFQVHCCSAQDMNTPQLKGTSIPKCQTYDSQLKKSMLSQTVYPHDTLSKNRLLFIIIMYYIQFSCISRKKSISSSEAIVAPIHITKDCLHRNQILIDNE